MLFKKRKDPETIYSMSNNKFDRLVKKGSVTVADVLKRGAMELGSWTEMMLMDERDVKKYYDFYHEGYDDNVERMKMAIAGTADDLKLSLALDALVEKERYIKSKKKDNTLLYGPFVIGCFGPVEQWLQDLGAAETYADVLRYLDDEEVKDATIKDLYRRHNGKIYPEIVEKLTHENIEEFYSRITYIAGVMDTGASPDTCFNENGFLVHEDGTEWEKDYIAMYRPYPEELMKEFYEKVDVSKIKKFNL